ncbi:MAG: elongation factor Ts [Candidatus Riflebacteria bacterium]|nr:elongation factor Ts [Candidatus Riflebacteria bacterium]
MTISAEMVRELREKTGAGMMKCKEALKDCNGDLEKAVDHLRKKGLASADGKSGRATSQGLVMVALSSDQRTAAVMEINCETDFVARNEQFREFAQSVINVALANKGIHSVADLELASLSGGQKIEEARKALIAKFGENMKFGRVDRLEIPSGKHGILDTYIHGEGSIGVVVQVECENPKGVQAPEIKSFAHEVALQVAAMKPQYVNRSEVAPDVVAREKDVVMGQIKNDPKNAGKPENIMQKIVEGRIDKFYKESCLAEQLYVKDDSKTILALSEEIGKKIGTKVMVTAFRRWMVGEKTASPVAHAETSCACACAE